MLLWITKRTHYGLFGTISLVESSTENIHVLVILNNKDVVFGKIDC